MDYIQNLEQNPTPTDNDSNYSLPKDLYENPDNDNKSIYNDYNNPYRVNRDNI